MHADEFVELMKAGVAGVFENASKDMPLTGPHLIAWAKDLSGSEEPADYFLHPVAFPLMLLPWWLERQLRGTYDPDFQVNLIRSNASLYYYIRLVDNIMDGHATLEPKLLPATGYFVDQFHSIYQEYFAFDHPFWATFHKIWGEFCDVTAADGQLADIDQVMFETLVARKVSAAKIALAAVCFACHHPELVDRWGEWVDLFGCWHLFREDLFDWQQDLQLNSTTYILAEARRRKQPGEPEVAWIAREGMEWAIQQLKDWMVRLRRFTFVSEEVRNYLDMREREVIERGERLKPALEFIRRLSESRG